MNTYVLSFCTFQRLSHVRWPFPVGFSCVSPIVLAVVVCLKQRCRKRVASRRTTVCGKRFLIAKTLVSMRGGAGILADETMSRLEWR